MFGNVFPWSRKKPASDERVSMKGKKVVLREKRIEDAPDDYCWRTDDELAGLDATRPLNMSYKDFLKYSGEELVFPSVLSKRFAIDTHDGKHIGNCMYYDIDVRPGEAEIGIMIGDRDYWGKGYGTDSVGALLDHIFTTTLLTHVYLHTLEGNQRARRSFAKAGFGETKTVRRSGSDFILMELTRAQWDRDRSLEYQALSGGQAADLEGRAVQDGGDGT